LVQSTHMYIENTALRYCLRLLMVHANGESVNFMKFYRQYKGTLSRQFRNIIFIDLL